MTASTHETVDGSEIMSRRTTADETRGPGTPQPPEGDALAKQAYGPGVLDLPELGSTVGRYVILNKVGSGGMGVVLAAYDPELDRKVALKLLHRRRGDKVAARARLHREAQALARLNHHNVVTVHDVGVHDEHVFVAMEFVEGQTLGAWRRSASPSWRETLEIFVDAGRGLAAAHQQGLVHRDFKPDNVMIGVDGRVLVMDFGLARSGEPESGAHIREPSDIDVLEGREQISWDTNLTATGVAVGTPAYMAPEQFSGLEVTAKSDQFGFCVALFEALYGARPFRGETMAELAYAVSGGLLTDPTHRNGVPGWLDRVLRRGLAPAPADRHEDMNALLLALGSSELRLKRKRVIATIGLALAGSAAILGYQNWELRTRVATCVERGEAVDDLWNAHSRVALRKGIIDSGVAHAVIVADKVMPWVDAQAESWRRATVEGCEHASVALDWSAEQFDKATWCLEERRLELSTFVTQMSHADLQAARKAVNAAASLRSVARCVDPRSLAGMPDAPSQEVREELLEVRSSLSEARYLCLSGQYERGLGTARSAREKAEGIRWSPVVASALFLESTLVEKSGDFSEAERVARRAYIVAAKAGEWKVATEAALSLMYIIGRKQARHLEGAAWGEHAQMAMHHGGDPMGTGEATRLNNLAAIRHSEGKFEAAMALHEEALALRLDALGAQHPTVASSMGNVAVMHSELGDYEKAAKLHEGALAIYESTLGSDHPSVASSLNNLANVYESLGRREEARGLYERALTIKEESLGRMHTSVAASVNNLAFIHEAAGELEEARELYARALHIYETALGPEHPYVALTLNNLGSLHNRQGRHETARGLYARGLVIRETAQGPDHPGVAYSLQGLGEALAGLGEYEVALRHIERAVKIRSENKVGDDLLANSRVGLARALWDAPRGQGGDRIRSVRVAQEARENLIRAGDAGKKDLAELERWLATR